MDTFFTLRLKFHLENNIFRPCSANVKDGKFTTENGISTEFCLHAIIFEANFTSLKNFTLFGKVEQDARDPEAPLFYSHACFKSFV